MRKRGFTVIEGVVSLAILSSIVFASTYFLSQMSVKALRVEERELTSIHRLAELTEVSTSSSLDIITYLTGNMEGVEVEYVFDTAGVELTNVVKVIDSESEFEFYVYLDQTSVEEGVI